MNQGSLAIKVGASPDESSYCRHHSVREHVCLVHCHCTPVPEDIAFSDLYRLQILQRSETAAGFVPTRRCRHLGRAY